jgi:hypothetical protein
MGKRREATQTKWQTIEKIVALLEKTLTPLAQVKHNVFLPVLGRPKREPRQCDIVIVYGAPPRETITIVEVQDRKSRLNLNTFHGWIVKMQEVGAQHLICVSSQGFPQSIIDDVAMVRGPTVRLMTLQELEEPNMGGIILGSFLVFKKPRFLLEEVLPGAKLQPIHVGKFQAISGQANLELTSDDKVFTLENGNERLSLLEMSAKVLDRELQPLLHSQGAREPDNYTLEVTLGSPAKDLYAYIKGQKYRVISLTMKWKVETEISVIPMRWLEYKQEFFDGTLAWVAYTKGEIDGKELEIQMIFKRDEHGLLQLALPRLLSVTNLSLELYSDENSWRAAINERSNKLTK